MTHTFRLKERTHLETGRRLVPTGTEAAAAEMSQTFVSFILQTSMAYEETKTMNVRVTGHVRRRSASVPSGLEPGAVEEISTATDAIAERVRKIGGVTLHSIGEIVSLQRVVDNDREVVAALEMLAELYEDNAKLAVRLRSAHSLCDEHGDVATESLIELWIDETERRVWFLYEATQH
jgi:starvation-inducible DNA-binding protein